MFVFPFLVTSPAEFFSFNPYTGVLGWMADKDSFIFVMFVIAPITGIIGNLGFYCAYYYWPMQIVAGTMLIEPFLAQIAGVMLGQDEIPGVKTLIGCVTITLGFFVSGFGARYKTMNKEKRRESMSIQDGDYKLLE